jgi:hypothetical protein
MRIIIITCFLLLSAKLQAQDLNQMLVELDSKIEMKEFYTEEKLNTIQKLKTRLEVYSSDKNYAKEYETCLKLFNEYRSFIYDSAFYYIEKAKYTALAINDSVGYSNAKVKQGFVLLSSGLFKEAIDTLETVKVKILSDSIKAQYYSVIARSYYDLADYGMDPSFIKKYQQKGNSYLDIALNYTKVNTDEYWAREGLKRMKSEDWKGAKHAFTYWINNYDLSQHSMAIATSSLGYIYSITGSEDKAIEYLILAANADIESATKETVALRNLAKILFERGDKIRAYNYIISAMEDATFYNARHRKIEIAAILPIIEGERLALVESQKSKLILFSIITVALACLILGFLLIIYFQLKKLRKTKIKLQLSINNLNILNTQLREANQIKEEYIGYFFNINSEYIEKLNTFQKNVLRKINQRKYDDLLKLVKNTNMRKERQFLFHRFDEIFLKIFPDFINEFNKLFLEQNQIKIKPNELLNSELRIFGLIRLGINDNEKIATFLNFSVTTVYTYKTKVKARSIYKNNFEEKLMAIKAI